MTDAIKLSKVSSRIAESFFMTQVAIEALLRDKIGLDAIAIGSSTIARSVYQRMAACSLTDITKYLIRLQTSTQELDELIEAVIVPETWFFRDREPFVFLRRYVLTEWLPTHPNGVLRVLSVPCSTGEEPYSIAIALIEAGLSPKNFHIDAVDISKKSLHKAQQGLYSRNSFRGKNPALPDLTQTLKGTDSLSAYALREHYFSRQGEQYQLHDRVKSTVNFIHGNLIDPYFLLDKSAYDVIFCRNVLIYFAPSARERTVRVLDRLLRDNGLLFVGHSETGQILTPPFVPVRHPLAFAHRKKENNTQELGNKKHSTIKSQHSEIKAVTSQKSGVKSRKPFEWQSSHLSTFQHSNLQSPTFQHSNLQPSTWATPRFANNLQPGLRPASLTTFNLQPPIPCLETARNLADRGHLEEAATLCETYLSQNRISAEAYVLLGQVRQAAGNNEQAEQCFHKAIYLEPYFYEALMHLALLKEHRGDVVNAAVIRQRIQRLQKFQGK